MVIIYRVHPYRGVERVGRVVVDMVWLGLYANIHQSDVSSLVASSIFFSLVLFVQSHLISLIDPVGFKAFAPFRVIESESESESERLRIYAENGASRANDFCQVKKECKTIAETRKNYRAHPSFATCHYILLPLPCSLRKCFFILLLLRSFCRLYVGLVGISDVVCFFALVVCRVQSVQFH